MTTATIIDVIEPPARDLGDGFSVKRALPAPARRQVGPFVFLDEMGPHDFAPGAGLDVRPHPHIGLATLTWLFAGELTHRDSTGAVQSLAPGGVNWMKAGRGVVHSERTGPTARAAGGRFWGMQAWVALHERWAEDEPAFAHHGAAELPVLTMNGARHTVVAGTAYDRVSPAQAPTPMCFVDIEAAAGAQVPLPRDQHERAVYVVAGRVLIDNQMFGAGRLVVVRPGSVAQFLTREPARVIVLGGASVGRKELWWNFVADDAARIERAREDWAAGRFGTVPGDAELMPPPDAPFRPAAVSRESQWRPSVPSSIETSRKWSSTARTSGANSTPTTSSS